MPKTTEVSDKEVARSRDRVEKLRQQIADEEAKLKTSESGRNNAVQKARLDAEASKLEQQLAAARQRVNSSLDDERIIEQVSTDEDAASPGIADKEGK